jgi:hypothetical protein
MSSHVTVKHLESKPDCKAHFEDQHILVDDASTAAVAKVKASYSKLG